MIILLAHLASLPAVLALCTVNAGNLTWNFTSLEGKQLTYTDGLYRIELTFCREGPESCDGGFTTLCQRVPSRGFEYALGLWDTTLWAANSSRSLVGTMRGAPCDVTGLPRRTSVIFTCANGPAAIKSFAEPTICVYIIEVSLPSVVCPKQCCSPTTYSLKTIKQVLGTFVVGTIQKDGNTGDFFDGTSPLKKLCSRLVNRCFTFLDNSSCIGSDYALPSSECVGANSTFVAEYPLVNVNGSGVLETVWSAGAGMHLLSVPLGDGCLVVGGTGRNPSFDLSTSVDSSLWTIPRACLKEMTVY